VTGQEDLKASYRRIIEAISKGDPGPLDGLMAPDIVDHNPVPNQAPGLDGFKQWMAAVRTTFPDLEGTVEDVLAEGDRVAARVTWRGMQRGDFAGMSATNKPVSFAAIHIVRFSRGLAVEWWGTADLLGALQQIGATISGPEGP
jgi:predicted ester cyclase